MIQRCQRFLPKLPQSRFIMPLFIALSTHPANDYYNDVIWEHAKYDIMLHRVENNILYKTVSCGILTILIYWI